MAHSEAAVKSPGGSFNYRGNSNAKLLNASTAICITVASDFDIYIHVKYPCLRALDFSGRRGHALDVIDYPQDNPKVLHDTRLHAAIFATDSDRRRRCKLPICVTIPHHFNLPCSPDMRGKRVGVVGTSFTPGQRDAVELELMLSNETVVGEVLENTCDFFNSLRVAIAWHRGTGINDSLGTLDMVKPAERFTNPIALGIPTFGYRGYPSYAEQDPNGNFLCDTLKCVREGIRKVDSGELRSEFAALRERVLENVSPKTNVLRYRALIERVTVEVGRVRLL